MNFTEQKRAVAEIDLCRAEHNFRAVRCATKSKLLCVVKANAYGHGALELSRLYERLGADHLATANVEEALSLREGGIALPILVLGYTPPAFARTLAEKSITQCVYSYEYASALAASARLAGVRVTVHIKLDSGMGRIGFLCRSGCVPEISQILALRDLPELIIEGIFTHFASSDEGDGGRDYTREQFNSFICAISVLESGGMHFKLKHCANSAAIFDYPEYHLDMVRAGIVLYGLKPSKEVKAMPDLLPVMSLCSVLSHIKTLCPDQSLSYGRIFSAKKELKVATVPIGYADGIFRSAAERECAFFVRGRRARIIGRVCMDQLMLDVTDIDCELGDRVIIFGDSSLQTADDLAERLGTINYEVLCSVGDRVERIYKDKNTLK